MKQYPGHLNHSGPETDGCCWLPLERLPGRWLLRLSKDLLACGADIVEMNTIRKRLSSVKGGRFALACEPAQVFSIVLSDTLLKS